MGNNNYASQNMPEIRIKGVSNNMLQSLKKIAAYYGITMSSLLKKELKSYIDSVPEHIKDFKEIED